MLATVPEWYPELVKLGFHASLLGLLTHENADISLEAVEVLNELTDPDSVAGSIEAALPLVDALVDNNALELLVQARRP